MFKMEECVFCKMIKGKIESVKIWEDEDFIAILDNYPNTEGMTLLLTKKHYNSYAFDMSNEIYKKFMMAAKKFSKILEKGLGIKRVAMVMEGMGIDHAHIKLYPLHGVDEKFKEMWGEKEIYFDKYEGYISTQIGPKKSIKELNDIANKIKKVQ